MSRFEVRASGQKKCRFLVCNIHKVYACSSGTGHKIQLGPHLDYREITKCPREPLNVCFF